MFHSRILKIVKENFFNTLRFDCKPHLNSFLSLPFSPSLYIFILIKETHSICEEKILFFSYSNICSIFFCCSVSVLFFHQTEFFFRSLLFRKSLTKIKLSHTFYFYLNLKLTHRDKPHVNIRGGKKKSI